MKKYDILLILVCLFVFRIITLSGSYPDAICLIALLGYMLGGKVLENKNITNEALVRIDKNHDLTQKQIQVLAEEVQKAKSSSEGLKAAMNLGYKK